MWATHCRIQLGAFQGRTAVSARDLYHVMAISDLPSPVAHTALFGIPYCDECEMTGMKELRANTGAPEERKNCERQWVTQSACYSECDNIPKSYDALAALKEILKSTEGEPLNLGSHPTGTAVPTAENGDQCVASIIDPYFDRSTLTTICHVSFQKEVCLSWPSVAGKLHSSDRCTSAGSSSAG